METVQSFHQQQKATWNQFSPGWAKWDDIIMQWMKPIGEKLATSASFPKDAAVLDVATGTGEPGISIAAMFPESRVTGMDISEEMLRVAAKKAETKGITNYTTVVGDESSLPFDNNNFDVIVSRFGVIFFPELEAGLKNLVSLLKPGGSISIAVWGPREKNPWATISAKAVGQELQLAPPPPEAPGIFRCEQVGLVAGILKDFDMKEVKEEEVTGENQFDTPEQYWSMMRECAAPIAMALKDQGPETIQRIKESVMASCVANQINGKVSFPYVAYVTSAVK